MVTQSKFSKKVLAFKEANEPPVLASGALLRSYEIKHLASSSFK